MATCPICKGTDTRVRMTVTASEAAGHFIAPDEEPARWQELTRHITELWSAPQSDLVACNTCGFDFAWPYVAGDGRFYELAYPRSTYPTDKWEFHRAIRSWQERQTGKARVLEIGAGDGAFLDLLIGASPTRPDIVATEYNPVGAAELKRKGVHALVGDVRQLSELQPPFDAIFMFQVLEHMDGLDALFARLVALLAPGGDLIIAVPNRTPVQFNEEHGSLIDCPPNHVGRWSPEAFRAIADASGLIVVATEYEPFSPRRFAAQDLYYSHKRRSQAPGSLAGKARSVHSPSLRRLAIMAEAFAHAPVRVPVWMEAARHRDVMGTALFAHLRKP